jgi:D-inositol-3-phosphate glycosyltransferase
MKLVLVGPAYPFRGGIAHFANALAGHLRESGAMVQVVNFRRLYPAFLFPGKSQFEPEAAPEWEGVIDALNPWTWGASVGAIIRERPDAVVFQYWEPMLAPVFGTIARRLAQSGVRTWCVVHNALPHQWRPGARLLGRYFLGACDGLIALSRKVEDELGRMVSPRVKIKRLFHPYYTHFGERVPQAEARRRLGVDLSARMILFFGMVRKYKGLQLLLEALSRVRDEIQEVQLIVAGEFYDDPAPYRDFIRNHSLEGCVRLENRYIPAAETADYFSAADVVALPYRSGTQSGVLSAALHFECPFIVSRAGGIAEMAPPAGGIIVPVGDPASLARALAQFFREAKMEELRHAIRLEKSCHTWGRFCSEMFALLEGQPF